MYDQRRNEQSQRRNSSLNIESERTIVEVPRGNDVLRLQHVVASTGDGKQVAWHSLRVFWKDDSGELRPGKQGITIRSSELKQIAEAIIAEAAKFSKRS